MNKIINCVLPEESLRRRYTKRFYNLINNKNREKIKSDNEDYKKWIEKNKLTEEQIKNQQNQIFEYRPLISIITPMYNTPEKFFLEFIDSIKKQTYSKWELCIADASDKKMEFLENIIKSDERIKYKKLEKNYGISENSNYALKEANGEYIVLVDHDDIISRDALYEIVNEINQDRDVDFLYSDEDKFEESLENRFLPFFKPDFSPDFLRSNNYICHLTAIKKELLENIGYFRNEYNGAQDYDLFLRATENAKKIVHISKILYHWRCHSESTAKNMKSKMYAIENGKKAIEDQLKRLKLNGVVELEKPLGLYRVKYLINNQEKISIIIPNKDSMKYLKQSIKSILKSTYKNYEIIIVENNSKDNRIFKYYEKIQRKANIKVIKYEINKFNYSKLNNFAVNYATGKYILLLNNDVKVINKNWLEEMLGICQREDVGIVGAKLLYYDNTIQHAGVVLGLGGIAGHISRTIYDNNPGYFARAKVINNFTAVTGACLMTKMELYKKVKGLDENLAVAFNDVDYCMKIRKLNKLVVYTPYAKLYHFESKSRGYEDTPEKKKRFENEIATFEEKWRKELETGDPYFNKNFDLFSEEYKIKYNK